MARQRSSILSLVGLLVVLSVLLSACGAQPTPASTPAPVSPATAAPPANTAVPPTPTVSPANTTGSLTVLDWAGYDTPDFWIDFKNTYPQVKVNFEFGASDGDIFSKMKAGDQADIFHPYTGWLQLYVDEGLVQEIDTSKLANWSKVPDNFKKIGQINGKQYFIPWDWGYTSILYRTDKVPGGIDSWSALMDPKFKGHVSMWDDGPGAVAVSAYIHGWGDETKVTADELAQAKQEWIRQRALNLFYWNAEPDLQQAMIKGDVWVAYAWQGSYATLLSKGIPVAYAHPKEGWNSWVGVYGIRKGSPNYDLALKFMDNKLALLTGQNLVNEYYYGDSNQDVMSGITDPTLKQAFSLDDPSVLQHTNFTPNLTTPQIDAWNAMWNEVKAAP
jgi:spermidine/putrescine transport system substrate-binding protein